MKILYLANVKDVHTYKWVKYFADKGDDIHIVSFNSSNGLENLENVHTHLLKRSYIFRNSVLNNTTLYLFRRIHVGATVFNPFFALKQVKKLIKEIKPDILHGHSIIHHTIIGALTGFHPFVVSAWGNDVLIYPKESKIVKYAVKFALRKADLITSDGGNTKDAMIKMGIEDEKIKIIFHGIDTEKFNPSHKDKNIANEFRISNSPTVISTRRMGSIHDVGTLIRAVPLVLEEIPDAKFIIVGEGEQKECLMDLAKSLDIFDVTRFVGWIPNDKLPDYLSSSDVYVSTSLSDSFAVSTLEAMACELAPVITDIGDNRRWIKNGKNGLIVPTKDPKALAGKIIYLLENERIRKKFGKINRKIVKEKADYYKEMEKMDKLYIELIERHKS